MSEVPVDQGPTVALASSRSGPSPLLVFALALLLILLSFGSAFLLIARSAPGTAATVRSAATLVATASAQAASAAPIRVVSASGTTEPLGTGSYRVVFTWLLEGAREGDTVLVRFSVGSRVLSEQRGTLDANVFASSTGRFTVSTQQECSTDGWAAELVTLRGLSPAGNATARVAGVKCS